MRIAFVLNTFPNLSETFILNQITGMCDLGHDLDIFSLHPVDTSQPMHEAVNRYGLLKKASYLSKGPRSKGMRILKATEFSLRNLRGLPQILRSMNPARYGKRSASLEVLNSAMPFIQGRYDIIQCHFGWVGNRIAELMELGIDGKLITMFHGLDILLADRGRQAYDLLYDRCDLLLANSEYTYNKLIALGADPQRASIHHVGLDLERFPYTNRSGEKSRDSRVVTVARLVDEKGIEFGIRAVWELKRMLEGERITYRIVGGGKLERELKELAIELGVTDEVEFLGSMTHEGVVCELSNADVFLLPSVSEAFGLSVVEAQAVGLPVVAAAVGGVSEAMVDGETGYLVEAGDFKAMAKKLEYLLVRPEMRGKMGEEGRKFVEDNFNIEELNSRLDMRYRELLER